MSSYNNVESRLKLSQGVTQTFVRADHIKANSNRIVTLHQLKCVLCFVRVYLCVPRCETGEQWEQERKEREREGS